MKICTRAFLMLGVGAVGTTLLTLPAAAIDFKFSFENALNQGGTVTGLIRGLEEGTKAATSVEVLSNTAGFGLGEYIGNPTNNSWTVLGGNLVAFDFLSFGVSNTPPAVTDAHVFFNSSELHGAFFRAGISSNPFSITIGDSSVSTEDISLTFTRFDDDVEVPEPTSILSLLGVGVAAMGTAFKRKQA